MVEVFRPRRSYITPAILVTALMTGASGILLEVAATGSSLPPRILAQIRIVCGVFAVSGIAFYAPRHTARLSVFFVKQFCVFFIVKAAGSEILSLVCIIFALQFEIWFFNGGIRAVAISALSAAVIALSIARHTAWDSLRPVLAPEGGIALVLAAVAASLAGGYLARAINRSVGQAEEIRRLEETVTALTKTNTAYQTYATYIEETSKEEERHRIAREIHDIVGYSMTNLLMIVQAALYSENQDQVTELLQKAQTHINRSLEEVRMAMRKLRSTQRRTLHGSELIQYLTDNFQKVTGISVSLDFISFPVTIGADLEEILYRMIQEAMTNSFRHGKASRIVISFWSTGGFLTVKIRDNGKKQGGTPIVEGIGLQGMRERIEEAGGTFTRESVKDGFTVQARLPLQGAGDGN